MQNKSASALIREQRNEEHHDLSDSIKTESECEPNNQSEVMAECNETEAIDVVIESDSEDGSEYLPFLELLLFS